MNFSILFFIIVARISANTFIQTTSSYYCQYDRIRIEWSVSNVLDEESVWVGLYDVAAEGTPVALPSQGVFDQPLNRWKGDSQLGTKWDQSRESARLECNQAESNVDSSVIQCDVGGPSCVVSVTHLGWDMNSRRLEIHFDQPTNSPRFELGRRSEHDSDNNPLDGILDLFPRPRLFATAPWWQSPSTLIVPVDLPMDQDAFAKAFTDQTATASVTRGLKAAPFVLSAACDATMEMQGAFATRIGGEVKPRKLQLGLWAHTLLGNNTSAREDKPTSSEASAPETAVAWSEPFTVTSCAEEAEEVVLHSLAKKKNTASPARDSHGDDPMTTARFSMLPFWDPKGVFALTGTRPLVLPTASLPQHGVGSWSFSCWLWIADGPNGNYRTLLFKGPGQGGDPNRTPSAWLKPDSMKVALRASMGVAHPDLGSDSLGELPLRKWCHVVFTFTNRTVDNLSRPQAVNMKAHDDDDDPDMKAHPWGYGLFVNGLRDVQINYPEAVTANTADFRVGKDPERHGPRALMAHPKLWPHALSQKQVLQEFEQGKSAFNGQQQRQSSSFLRRKRSKKASSSLSLAALASVTLLPFSSFSMSGSGVALNPLLTSHPTSHTANKAVANPTTLKESVLGNRGKGALSSSLARHSGLFDFTVAAAASASESSLVLPPSADHHAQTTAEENEDDGDDDPDKEEEEEAEALRARSVHAAEVHFRAGVDALKACESADARLEAFEAAAKLGHVEAAAAAAGLLLAGEEMIVNDVIAVEIASTSSSSCPRNSKTAGAGVGAHDLTAFLLPLLSLTTASSTAASAAGAAPLLEKGSWSTARGLLYLQFASSVGGCAACARRFAALTLAGIGAGALARDRADALNAERNSAAASASSLATTAAAAAAASAGANVGATSGATHGATLNAEPAPTPADDSPEREEGEGGGGGDGDGGGGGLIVTAEESSQSATPSTTTTVISASSLASQLVDVSACTPSLGAAAFDRSHCAPPTASPVLRQARGVPTVTEVGVGLLHCAAAMDDGEAQLALAHRYKHGLGVEASAEAAAFYYAAAAEKTSALFHTTGRQPSNEMNRLRDGEEMKAGERERGDEDEQLRLLVSQAEEEGQVLAMNELAGLLYWGHRGFARDHPRALGLWDGVARAGDAFDANPAVGDDPFPGVTTGARVAAAGMFLKGEGCPNGAANLTRAVELYERAAASGSVPALNGLGYLYFQGQELPQDLPRAFGYFSEAATLGHDGDSMYNAGHCLANGLGTPADQEAAVAWFEKAAFTFGHFDSIHELGTRHLIGRHPRQPRNVHEAMRFLEPSAGGGEWGGKVRQAFDAFLARNPSRAFVLYCEAAEAGLEIAQSNAAYLLDRRYLPSPARNLLLLDHGGGGGSDGDDGLNDGRDSALQPSSASSSSSPSASSPWWWSNLNEAMLSLVGLHSSSTHSTTTAITAMTARGNGIDDSDVEKLWALHFHRRAAELGNHESFTAIGDAFFYGTGVDAPSNPSPSLDLSHNRIGGGSGKVGRRQPDYEGALWWYSKAAQAGVARGAYSLGYMYERGLGAPASETRAERHYRKAAELLAAEAKARQGRGAGAGEGGWGEWYAEAVLACSLAALRVRRSLRRAVGAEFFLPPRFN